MDILIAKTDALYGRIKAPPSKSYTHRALVASSLNDEGIIINPLISDATYAMRRACEALGAKIVDDNAWKKVVEGVYKGFSR